MITWDEIKTALEIHLGSYVVQTELTIDELAEKVVKNEVLPLISKYLPCRKQIAMDYNEWPYKVYRTAPDGTKEEDQYTIRLVDPDGQPILWVEDVIPNMGQYMMVGYPYSITFDANQAQNAALDIFEGSMALQFNKIASPTFEFVPPDFVRVYGTPWNALTPCTIIYACEHVDPTTVPRKYKSELIDLAVAMAKMTLGELRSMFNINTPYGTLEVRGDMLKEEGRSQKQMLEEKLRQAIPYKNLIVG